MTTGKKTANLKQERPKAKASDSEKRIKIMVIDDEQYILDLICEFLRDNGYEVSTALSGEEAINRFQTEKADIVMVDFKMPGIDGLATIKRLTEMSPPLVSILMTGFPTLDSSIQALRIGASDYILKPFKMDEVSLSVHKAVKEWIMKKELTRLRHRVTELEASISEKKDSIKLNKKLGVFAGPQGYSPKFIGLTEPADPKQ